MRYTIKKLDVSGEDTEAWVTKPGKIILQTTDREKAIDAKNSLERKVYRENFFLLRSFIHNGDYSKSMERYAETSKYLLEKYDFTFDSDWSKIDFNEKVTDEVLDFIRKNLGIEFFKLLKEDKPIIYFIPSLNPSVIVEFQKGNIYLKNSNNGIDYFYSRQEALEKMALSCSHHIRQSFNLHGTLEDLSYTPDLLEECIDAHESILYKNEILSFGIDCSAKGIIAINDLLIDRPIIISKKEH